MNRGRSRSVAISTQSYALVIFAVYILLPISLLVSVRGAYAADARNLAKEAYYQIEAHVFEPEEIRDATDKIKNAYLINPNEAYIRLSLSLLALVRGYKIGDWYEKSTFIEGTIEKSFSAAKEAIALDPELAQTYAHLARLSILRRNMQDSVSFLQKAKQLDNASFYPWYFEGILFEKTGSPLNASHSFEIAEKYITHDHQRTILNVHRQHIARLMNDIRTQEVLLKENIANNPDDPHVYGNYAMFLKQQRRYKESIAQWENALEKGRYRHAEEQLVETKRLLNAPMGKHNNK